MKKLLLVDDNDKYAKILEGYFSKYYQIERAYNGKEGLEKVISKGKNYYNLIVTDITMESQLAGIYFLKKIREEGYKGHIIITSTGFNYGIVLYISALLLGNLKIDYLIPKDTLLKNNIKFYTCEFPPKLEEEKLSFLYD